MLAGAVSLQLFGAVADVQFDRDAGLTKGVLHRLRDVHPLVARCAR